MDDNNEDKDEGTLYYLYTYTTCWQPDDLLLDIKRWDESVKRKAADMIDNIQTWCPTLDNNNSGAHATEASKIVVKVEPLDVVKEEETDAENMRCDNDVTLPIELNVVTEETMKRDIKSSRIEIKIIDHDRNANCFNRVIYLYAVSCRIIS